MFNSSLIIKASSALLSTADLLVPTYFLSLLITNIPISWLPHLYTHSEILPTIPPLPGLLLPSARLAFPFPDHWLYFKSVPSTHFLCLPLVLISLDCVAYVNLLSPLWSFVGYYSRALLSTMVYLCVTKQIKKLPDELKEWNKKELSAVLI